MEPFKMMEPPSLNSGRAHMPKAFCWFTSVALARILLGESVIGFALFFFFYLWK